MIKLYLIYIMSLTKGVRFPNLDQKVTLVLKVFPVLWSKHLQVSKGGEYRWRLQAVSVWLLFSTLWRPFSSIQKKTKLLIFPVLDTVNFSKWCLNVKLISNPQTVISCQWISEHNIHNLLNAVVKKCINCRTLNT